MYKAKMRNIGTFKASDGWFARWRWRYIAKSVKLQGEAADTNLEEAEAKMRVMRDAIASGGYQACNVFNMDETALVYKTIPNRTHLLAKGDKRQAGKGTNQMNAKDRLTVILHINANGACKLPPVIIGSAKNPRCFRRNPPKLPYYQQKKSLE